MQFIIKEEDNGMKVGAFIKRELCLSSKMLKFLKYREDGIRLSGKRVTVRAILSTGDLLELAVEDEHPSDKIEPCELPLEILYEDNDLVIPSKPANMPTHPSKDHYRDTVANALAHRYREGAVPFVFRPVNRLDRNTSGLLLIARNKLTAGRLSRAMQEGQIRKTYLAVLDGEWEEASGVIDACLHRSRDSIIVREICSPDAPDADRARTEYTVLARGNGHTLVSASPVTGRTHQLRVHFSSVGHPISGDDLYGTPSPLIARQALHAHTLTLPHPVSGKEMTVRAPLPQDLRALLQAYFPSYEPID